METTVKTYSNAKLYASDLTRMQEQGWRKVDVVEKTKPRGCLTIFPVSSDLIVTYERDTPPPDVVTIREGNCPNCGASITQTAYYCPNCNAPLRT